jgi:hypothetical protein
MIHASLLADAASSAAMTLVLGAPVLGTFAIAFAMHVLHREFRGDVVLYAGGVGHLGS